MWPYPIEAPEGMTVSPNESNAATRSAPSPGPVPGGRPATAAELEALVARGRMLRARAVRALWLRLRRRYRTLFGSAPARPGRPAAQPRAAPARRCEA